MDYKEKLKDPRWQKKRLEIMEWDNFTCVDCGSTTKTLHVHHKTYTFGNDPWDYPDDNFATLCWECHEDRTTTARSTKELMNLAILKGVSTSTIHGIMLDICIISENTTLKNNDLDEFVEKYVNVPRGKELREKVKVFRKDKGVGK